MDRYVIRLDVPGVIGTRDVVLRTVSSACKLAMTRGAGHDEAAKSFGMQVVSAVGEAFNNIALHAYRDRPVDVIRLVIEVGPGWIRVRMEDFGTSFAFDDAPPPAELPEHGMGVFIIKSFMDEVSYAPGTPNAITLFKRLETRDS